MMKITCTPVGAIAANCYLVVSGDAALVIDPGDWSQALEQKLEPYMDKIQLILLTHRHADHLMAAAWLQEKSGAKTAIHLDDAAGLLDPGVSLSAEMGVFAAPQRPLRPDLVLKDKEVLECGNMHIQVLHTPGHSQGGVCYLIDDGDKSALFTGDTLFAGEIGRTDLPTGDYPTLMRSLVRLAELPGDYHVYPGHGSHTLLSRERTQNSYMAGAVKGMQL